jgi:hypothetical protein
MHYSLEYIWFSSAFFAILQLIGDYVDYRKYK